MALPKLVTSPRYSTMLPSTGEYIDYRPYTVKEEKILMIALETKDQKQILRTLKDVVRNCVENIDVQELTTFDLEWIFLKLRAKSVGENATLKLKCQKDPDCGGQTEVQLNLDEIDIKGEVLSKTIAITDEVGVTVKYPTVDIVEKYENDKLESIDGAFDMISKCIVSIYDKDTVYETVNETPEDVKEFLDSLSSQQFKGLIDFFTNIPEVNHNLEWKCSKCGEESQIELKGIDSFFT